MAFAEETIKKAWERAKGKCECERQGHGHGGGGQLKAARCNKTLAWGDRRRETAWGAWDVYPKAKSSGTDDKLDQLEVLCWNCHQKILAAPQHKPRNS